jgi:hypothetical protein
MGEDHAGLGHTNTIGHAHAHAFPGIGLGGITPLLESSALLWPWSREERECDHVLVPVAVAVAPT